jgi:hypothetical protein
MSTFKKTKVVMLPTNKKAPNHDYLFLYKPSNRLVKDGFVQHLYFLLDEPIKEGDWCIMLDSIGNVFSNPQQYTDPSTQYLNKGHRKIIATTDKSLMIEGKCSCMKPEVGGCYQCNENLPQPSQSFIEKFVEEYNKGNVITEVMVEYERDEEIDGYGYDTLKINFKDNTITIRKIKDSWNREEVVLFAEKYARMVQEKEIQLNGYKAIHNHKFIEENL